MTTAIVDPLDPIRGGWWPPGVPVEEAPATAGDLPAMVRTHIASLRAEAASQGLTVPDGPARGLGALAALAVAAREPIHGGPDVVAAALARPFDHLAEAAADGWASPVVEQILAVLESSSGLTRATQRLAKLVRSRADALRGERAAEQRDAEGAALVEGLPGVLEGYRVPRGWRVSGAGLLRQSGDTGPDPRWIRVAARPAFVAGVAVDRATGERFLDLCWEPSGGGALVCRTVPRAEVATAAGLVGLAAYGAPMHAENARHFAAFLADLEDVNAAALPRRAVVSGMGWASTVAGERAFVLGRDVLGAEGVEIRPAEGTEPLLAGWGCRGTLAGWQEAVAPVVARYPVVGALYLASLASPLLSLLGCPSFIVDVACETGHGKSSALGLACSVWGDPTPGAGVFHTWDGTEVAVERISALSGHLPLCLDETKLAGGARARDTAQILYRLAAGQGRLRGRPDGLRRVAGWRFVVLSTGEAPVVNASHDAGTRARVLSLTAPPYGSQSAEGRRVTESTGRTIRAHHGHAGRGWVEYLLGADVERLRERLEDHTEQYAARFVPGTATRLAAHAAVLLLAGDLAREAGLPIPDLDAVAEALADVVECGAADADRPRAALVDLLSWVEANPRRVDRAGEARHPDGDGAPHAGWIARVRGDGAVAVVGAEAEQYLERRGYDRGGVVRAWAGDRSWIDTPPSGHTRPVRFSDGSRPRCYVVRGEVAAALNDGREVPTAGEGWQDRDDGWGPR